MGGLILIFIVGLWFSFVLFFVFLVSKLISQPIRKLLVACFLFFALLPLPLLDEIVGSRQFAELCKTHSKVYFDQTSAIGRTVYLQDFSKTPDQNIENAWLKLTLEHWVYLDALSHEVVISYDVVRARRKWFAVFESGYPILFPSSCAGGGDYQTINHLFKELHVRQVKAPYQKEN